MAFGQQSGPPATHSQLRELTTLLEAAGHLDFRDARGPLGFTQRQAGGKFTRDEADAFIQQLQEEAWIAEGVMEAPEPEKATISRPKGRAAPKPTKADKALAALTDQQLATELQARGWVVMEP
ncbi:MAG: hypothetical protein HKN26_13335 [Acidimicrobiales bacterium]|nr:hypothetical protein [Acidimicrobiales bacterium]